MIVNYDRKTFLVQATDLTATSSKDRQIGLAEIRPGKLEEEKIRFLDNWIGLVIFFLNLRFF
jgi:hypothetical protein